MISHRTGRTGIPAALSVLALACLWVAASPAFAQNLPDLRGGIEDETQPEAGLAGTGSDTDEQASPTQQAAPAPVPTTSVEEEDARSARAGLDNLRIGAIEGGEIAREDDPYAALGIRAGTFILRPQLEQGIGWTSNSAGAAGGRASTFSETARRLDAQSDWSRHSACFAVDGSYRKSISGERIDEFDGSATGRIDFDLANRLAAFASAGYRVNPESASTPGSITAALNRPLRHTLDASAGISRNEGLVRVGLTGALTRQTFEDAELAGGIVASQRERDSTLATATLRAGYAVSPALVPFVEAEIGRRTHDLELDSAGYARSANRYALRGGVALDLGEKLNGEIAAGWLTERPDDSRLGDVSGLSISGNLRWSPIRGTVVALSAMTTVEGSTTPGDSGSLLYSGNAAVERELRANLTGRLSAGLDWRDYSGGGHDLLLRGEAGLTWWMNRNAGITARARHEIQESSLAGRDWDATSVWLGMTLRR